MPKHKVALLAGKRVLVLATTDAEAPAGETRSEGESSPGGQVALLESLWRATFAYCGISDFHFRMLYGMRTVEPTERREWLDRVAGEAFAPFAT